MRPTTCTAGFCPSRTIQTSRAWRHHSLLSSYSGTEVIFPYCCTCFAGIVGKLAGNHYHAITEGREHLRTGTDCTVRRCPVHSVRADLAERGMGYSAGQRPPGR